MLYRDQLYESKMGHGGLTRGERHCCEAATHKLPGSVRSMWPSQHGRTLHACSMASLSHHAPEMA